MPEVGERLADEAPAVGEGESVGVEVGEAPVGLAVAEVGAATGVLEPAGAGGGDAIRAGLSQLTTPTVPASRTASPTARPAISPRLLALGGRPYGGAPQPGVDTR